MMCRFLQLIHLQPLQGDWCLSKELWVSNCILKRLGPRIYLARKPMVRNNKGLVYGTL